MPIIEPRSAASAPLRGDAIAGARALLVEAFFDNPAHVYILPDPATRRTRLNWLFARNLAIQLEIGRSFCALAPEDPGRVDAMAFWHAPGTPSVGLSKMLRHGLASAPLRIGLGGTRRLVETTTAVDAQLEAAHPRRDAWLLNNMVVRSDRRGAGLGTELLGEQLGAVIDASRRPALLATQRPENVTFYERLRFQVASEQTIGTGPHAFRNWTLIYRPRPAS